MSLIQIYLIGIGGFLGACSRFFVSGVFARRCSTKFPYGTLTVNLIGSFFLGLLFACMNSGYELFMLFFATGFLGSFTTFSTFKVEILKMYIDKNWKVLFLYISCSYVLGILLAYIGFLIGVK
ncbi:fluoride efflux transporter CrcB [Chengkuizengella sediminis]|uniref:fluoride efflux transporter CrcB n=1 Tax=Chengkuizengella sediminis TaxID=1885917 RepID=UPI001389A04C|nr:fluoride efflux transporter CrcB [Chengkuizengella sediminis]NDI33524.1 fluoride efflux transporter CrcB [Chengkuizengella sediminis]